MATTTYEYLFVYGTLMKGYHNPLAEKLQTTGNFEGFGSLPGLLYLVDWYPAASHAPDATGVVYGEVYKLNNARELIQELDEYEDVFEDELTSLYIRKKLMITLENDSTIECWVYLYNQSVSDLKLIESGDFRDCQEGYRSNNQM